MKKTNQTLYANMLTVICIVFYIPQQSDEDSVYYFTARECLQM